MKENIGNLKIGQNTSPALLHNEKKEQKEYNRHSPKLQDNTKPINTESVCQKEKRERMELTVHSLTTVLGQKELIFQLLIRFIKLNYLQILLCIKT